ncbi:MAG: N-acetylmuramoyl-L-alanine amidase [Acidobacteria bacterium]|nr:N-acetylmuramoyl-L-alanine amidase [Acidobacteriota bacterium]
MRGKGAIACAAAVAVLLPAATQAATKRVAVPEIGSPTPVAVMTGSGTIHIEAKPRVNEGLLAFAKRLCGDSRHSSALSRANGGVRRLKRGIRYKVPFDLLPRSSQEASIRALLPKDQATTDGWRHRVASSARGRKAESLWIIAEWFTGDGENHRILRQANSLTSNVIRPGQMILVPRRLLIEPFAAMLPAPPPRTAAVRTATEPTPFIRYGSDEQGEYASYRLKAGEALYSSVVMRFTGRLFAGDVNELVKEIKERNRIGNVRDLPVGYEVKIPLDLLSARYLPADDPRRVEWEAQRAAGGGIENKVLALDLDGVTVVLDAGHGGRDTGAPVGGIWESNYVYDIMLRTKKVLESRTAATVVPTTREGSTFRIDDLDVLPKSRGHAVLTSPPYRIDDGTVATNFRWYLANWIYQQRRKAGADAGQVIFISIHADSLHPSLRGAMVYIPGLVGITNNYGKTGAPYSSRREVRAGPRVSFTRSERTTSKGLSRDLAEHMLASFRNFDLAVHHNVPIRDRIVRRRGAYVPAQIRWNRVPAKILLEVGNLANEQDRRLMKTRAYRQRVAEAIVDGILSYYGVPQGGAHRAVTAGGS